MKDASNLTFSERRKGSGNPNWKGGQKYKSDGYVLILKPNHYRAYCDGYVMRSVLVLEKKLKRPIRFSFIPHHLNGIKDDDRPENLIELSPERHNTIHKKGIRKGQNGNNT